MPPTPNRRHQVNGAPDDASLPQPRQAIGDHCENMLGTDSDDVGNVHQEPTYYERIFSQRNRNRQRGYFHRRLGTGRSGNDSQSNAKPSNEYLSLVLEDGQSILEDPNAESGLTHHTPIWPHIYNRSASASNSTRMDLKQDFTNRQSRLVDRNNENEEGAASSENVFSSFSSNESESLKGTSEETHHTSLAPNPHNQDRQPTALRGLAERLCLADRLGLSSSNATRRRYSRLSDGNREQSLRSQANQHNADVDNDTGSSSGLPGHTSYRPTYKTLKPDGNKSDIELASIDAATVPSEIPTNRNLNNRVQHSPYDHRDNTGLNNVYGNTCIADYDHSHNSVPVTTSIFMTPTEEILAFNQAHTAISFPSNNNDQIPFCAFSVSPPPPPPPPPPSSSSPPPPPPLSPPSSFNTTNFQNPRNWFWGHLATSRRSFQQRALGFRVLEQQREERQGEAELSLSPQPIGRPRAIDLTPAQRLAEGIPAASPLSTTLSNQTHDVVQMPLSSSTDAPNQTDSNRFTTIIQRVSNVNNEISQWLQTQRARVVETSNNVSNRIFTGVLVQPSGEDDQAPSEPGDDPTHQQLIFFGGIFLGPVLFALGGFLFFLTPREFKKTRMWALLNLLAAVICIFFMIVYSYDEPSLVLFERIETYGPSDHNETISFNKYISPGVLKVINTELNKWSKTPYVKWSFSNPESFSRWTPIQSDPLKLYARVHMMYDEHSNIYSSSTDTSLEGFNSSTIIDSSWVLGPLNPQALSKDEASSTIFWTEDIHTTGRLLFSAEFGWGDSPPKDVVKQFSSSSITPPFSVVMSPSSNSSITHGDDNIPYNFVGVGLRCCYLPHQNTKTSDSLAIKSPAEEFHYAESLYTLLWKTPTTHPRESELIQQIVQLPVLKDEPRPSLSLASRNTQKAVKLDTTSTPWICKIVFVDTRKDDGIQWVSLKSVSLRAIP